MTSRPAKLRYGMAGGGEGAFIGAVHRIAAAMDGDWELVCGAFSSDGDRNRRSADSLRIGAGRAYASVEAMLAGENQLPPDERMEAVVIVTPNHLHKPTAVAALDAGFHVLSEKPMALDLTEALEIEAAVVRTNRLYGLAFTYSGYPMVAEARARIASGELGRIRLVEVAYIQGWLSEAIDADGHKQADWRTDPARAGLGGCLGDIGTHAFQLAEHISGLTVEAVSADLNIHVPGRRLDDDVSALLRLQGGATGVLRASQVATGVENDLTIRIFGDRGGMEWHQMEPNSLIVRWPDRPFEIVRTGGAGVGPSSTARQRVPAGHPEGYLEAFANLYRRFAQTVRSGGTTPPPIDTPEWFPGIADGIRTMTFVQAAVANHRSTEKWTQLAEVEQRARQQLAERDTQRRAP
ncbi:Gfo/Idh/MocA family protein [Sphingobium algorifonticola]|uniref:Gfo/Idh/MocA family oxidoreductase n=1 Tax=Sphingobium algorifonticola TaxID=2008318 RepID=A0A437J9Y0_9SPHN|nr:Gfo/Idh/MocA family oxidoreductase [Sphingobium algorifonticola]RVT42295.1 Gfo/Idh/MocA family oxidoreductase [Sphingobium algorifonticola]